MTPPNNVELEQAILGAILLDSEAIGIVVDLLTPEKFYDNRHQLIYSAVSELYRENRPIDILTVSQKIKKLGNLKEAGGPVYLSGLTNRITSSVNIESWVMQISELYMRRQFALISAEVHTKSYHENNDVFDIYAQFSSTMDLILQDNIKKDSIHISALTKEAQKNIDQRLNSDSLVNGYASGIINVDRLLGGHQKSDLTYLAGRPGMGKTAMALSEILNLALSDIPVAFFSLEMSRMQIVFRLLSMISGIDAEVLIKKRLEPHTLSNFNVAVDRINALPIYIDDTPALSVYDLRAKCRRLKSKNKIEIVFIDYVQLMTLGNQKKGNSFNREQEISTISRNLKQIAKECDIPVVCLAQLSRGVESRTDKRPLLSDLRESGSLEQDADVVAFLYRPEYYGIDFDSEGNSTRGLGEYIVAKQRNGPTGIAQMRFEHNTMRYTDYNY
jgi:replicative DNA helicase